MLYMAGLAPIIFLASLPLLSKIEYAYGYNDTGDSKELIDISWFLQTPAATGAFSGSLFFGMIFQWDVLKFTERYDSRNINLRDRKSLILLNISWMLFVIF